MYFEANTVPARSNPHLWKMEKTDKHEAKMRRRAEAGKEDS